MTGLIGLSALLTALTLSHSSLAAYPDRPIRFIVPVAAGGGNDMVARLLGQKMTAKWGQPVVVDNRPGASTAIGSLITAKSAPDGYTIMILSVSFAINASHQQQLPFDPIKDFSAVTQLARVPQILLVNPNLPAKNITEFVRLAKSRPGQLNYGSAGAGSSTHLAMAIFADMTGIELIHIPYKGTGPALSDLIGGQVQTIFDAIPPTLPHIKSGKVRALGVGSAKRFLLLPEVATFTESGLPQYDFASWFGVLAPAQTPTKIIQTLNRELIQELQLPDIKEHFNQMGLEPLGSSPEAFALHLQKEIQHWSALTKQFNLH